MRPRTSYQMLLKTLRSTYTYILTCFNSSMVSLLYHTAQSGGKAAATAGEENWPKAGSFPSSENICLLGFGGFFCCCCWSCRNGTNKHCRAMWVREERGSTLQQTEASEKDGYSSSLSHPSQTHRLLQLSHCAKQLALQKIVFSFEDLCSASAS